MAISNVQKMANKDAHNGAKMGLIFLFVKYRFSIFHSITFPL